MNKPNVRHDSIVELWTAPSNVGVRHLQMTAGENYRDILQPC